MDNMIKKFRLGELFCGPGGLALGAIQASISDPDYRIVHEWANDYDLDTCNTYRRNICPNDRESVVHGDVYGIMDSDKPAPTITGGCLCYSKGRYGHYSQDRAISIREAARLQTFPDDFIFSNSLTDSALQIGNAVPIDLVKASGEIFKAAIKSIKMNRAKAAKKGKI